MPPKHSIFREFIAQLASCRAFGLCKSRMGQSSMGFSVCRLGVNFKGLKVVGSLWRLHTMGGGMTEALGRLSVPKTAEQSQTGSRERGVKQPTLCFGIGMAGSK